MMMLRLVLISDISDKDVAKHKELLYMRRCRSEAARGVRACAGGGAARNFSYEDAVRPFRTGV